MPETKTYEIKVDELLDKKWEVYFAPFKLIPAENATVLLGEAHDQAELFGLLLKIRDSGLHLLSVRSIAGN